MTNRKAPERRGKVQLVDAREYFVKMRKSLGEKRKEISDAQIDEITRLYGEFTEGEKVKIFPNEAFGFLRITVERPLRLRWEVTDDDDRRGARGQGRSRSCPTIVQLAVRELAGGASRRPVRDRARAGQGSRDLRRPVSVWPQPAQKAVWSALAVRDEEAPIVTDRKGNPEPDPDLRDNENVPLPSVPVTFEEDPTERFATLEYRTAVDDYMRDEVLPVRAGRVG